MDQNRPRGREKNVTGQGSGLGRKGSGLGTGPVGSNDGYSGRGSGSGGGGRKITRGAGLSLHVHQRVHRRALLPAHHQDLPPVHQGAPGPTAEQSGTSVRKLRPAPARNARRSSATAKMS